MVKSNTELITICSSSDEDDDANELPSSVAKRSAVDVKPKCITNGTTSNVVTNNRISENNNTDSSTRAEDDCDDDEQDDEVRLVKKIDSMLASYDALHKELTSLEFVMDSQQRLRWQRIIESHRRSFNSAQDADEGTEQVPSSSNYQPAAGGGTGRPFAPQRPPWFIDPPSSMFASSGASSSRRTNTATTSRSRTSTTSRKPAKRRFKRKRKTPKKTSSSRTPSKAPPKMPARASIKTSIKKLKVKMEH